MPLRKANKTPIVWEWNEAEREDRANTGQMSAIIRYRRGKYAWYVASGNVFSFDNEIASGEEGTSKSAQLKTERVMKAGS